MHTHLIPFYPQNDRSHHKFLTIPPSLAKITSISSHIWHHHHHNNFLITFHTFTRYIKYFSHYTEVPSGSARVVFFSSQQRTHFQCKCNNHLCVSFYMRHISRRVYKRIIRVSACVYKNFRELICCTYEQTTQLYVYTINKSKAFYFIILLCDLKNVRSYVGLFDQQKKTGIYFSFIQRWTKEKIRNMITRFFLCGFEKVRAITFKYITLKKWAVR